MRFVQEPGVALHGKGSMTDRLLVAGDQQLIDTVSDSFGLKVFWLCAVVEEEKL